MDFLESLKKFRVKKLENKYINKRSYICAVDVESILIDIKRSNISEVENLINNYLLKLEDIMENNQNGFK
tara:strand:- start:63 stop:272 length:210 start_codon:yes stop_codon:yes gene_type:complete